ncbi:DNRLRE domain-containing protein [Microtetraspora malaysiensis]|uniref:DNRLRE domain-containing protein n=1 Tax=Microtetraspora malaysiensis TaxID=161358 RepID=UPI003D8B41AA
MTYLIRTGSRAVVATLVAAVFVLSTAPASQAQEPPVIGEHPETWTYVSSQYPDASYSDTDGPVPVGRNPDTGEVTRAYFQFDLSKMAGRHIIRAYLSASRVVDCGGGALEFWQTNPISRQTKWINQPRWKTLLAVSDSLPCYRETIYDPDLTESAAEAAAHSGILTLGVRAVDEEASTAPTMLKNNPDLVIEYNTVPAKPTALTIANEWGPSSEIPCHKGKRKAYVRTATPLLDAYIDGRDGNTYGRFEWARSDGQLLGDIQSSFLRGPGRTHAYIPIGKLPGEGSYKWRVRAESPYGPDSYDVGPWSDWCEFTVDLTPPRQAPLVSSSDYPPDRPSGGVGIPGDVVFTSNGETDLAAYRYVLNDQLPLNVSAREDGSAKIGIKPLRDQRNSLTVYSIDRAGNTSPPREYKFDVNPTRLPEISSTDYPGGGEYGGWVARAGKLTFTPNDLASLIAKYQYTLNDDSAVTVRAEKVGPTSVTITPTRFDENSLRVVAIDKDGDPIWKDTYQFLVKGAPTISSNVYPQFEDGGGIGVPGDFIFAGNALADEISFYRYSFEYEWREVQAAADGSATVTLTPNSSGFWALEVEAVSRDGTTLWAGSYYYLVNSGSTS